GSGNMKFISLDVYDNSKLIISVKATNSIKDAALRGIKKLWDEAMRGARGARGHGDNAKPAMVFALEEAGEYLLLIRLTDYADLATGRQEAYIPSSKAENRREHSRRSLLDS